MSQYQQLVILYNPISPATFTSSNPKPI